MKVITRGFSTQLSLLNTVKADMKRAMMNKNQNQLMVLKSIVSELNYALKSPKSPASTNSELILVLQKMVKKRMDSVDQYRKAGRNDLASKEEEELKVVEQYLPTPLKLEEIEFRVAEVIKQLNASSQKDMGKVMKELKTILDPSVAPNTIVSQVVSRLLTQRQ